MSLKKKSKASRQKKSPLKNFLGFFRGKFSESQMAPTGKMELKKSERKLLEPLGASGTANFDGFITEEYNTKLSGLQGQRVYDEMRKGDAQINATLLSAEMPIRSTKWFIEAAKNKDGEVEEKDQEIADFVSMALFEKMCITWDSLLSEILTMLPFGFSVFEKVYEAEDDKIWLKNLASRKQTTIEKWETEDGSAGVTQNLPNEVTEGENKGDYRVSIPDWKLIIFSYRREGDNYEGVPLLRSAYKHWFFKNKFYNFDAVKHEKSSVGIPVMYLGDGASDNDKTAAENIVKNLRANEQMGVVIPGKKEDGWEFEFADTRVTTSSTEIYESIKHHNREISKNILAQFLELGATESGSRALGDNQTRFFLLAVEGIAKLIADTFNRYIIPELVDFNFDDVENYPKLNFQNLGVIDFESLSKSLKNLADSAIITPDDKLEEHVRGIMDLPAKTQEGKESKREIKNKKEKEKTGDAKKKIDEEVEASEPVNIKVDCTEALKKTTKKINELANKINKYNNEKSFTKEEIIKMAEQELTKIINECGDIIQHELDKEYHKQTKGKQCHDNCGDMQSDEIWMQASQAMNNKFITKLQNEIDDKKKTEILKSQGFKFNEFEKKSPRPLTFAERKVNFTSIKRAMDSFGDIIKEEIDIITAKQKEDLLKQIQSAVEKNDVKAIGEIKAKHTGELSRALTNTQKEMFEIGKKSAATEMGVKIPPTNAEVRGAMRVQNDTMVEGITDRMETDAKSAVNQTIAKKGGAISAVTPAEAVSAASQTIDTTIQKSKSAMNTLAVSGSLNMGRTTIFERYPEKIYGFQYSAILDERTTETCLSLDGRVVPAGSDAFYTYSPPRHFNCRSVWVEILMEEKFKPRFTTIPNSIPDNPTVQTHQKMLKPTVLKNSPAIKVIQQEIKERKSKLDGLIKSGKFPNRQATHQKRIKRLESSIKGKFSELQKIFREILKTDGIKFKEK